MNLGIIVSKAIVVTLFSVLGLIVYSPHAAINLANPQDVLPELVRRIKPSAVAIETYDSRGEKLSRGSGFFIEIDRIVTNRHVIEGAYRAEIHSSTGTVYPVKGVLAVDAEGDLAVLKIDAPSTYVRPLPLDKTSPQEGESVVVIGNPLGLEGSVTNGIVSAVRDIPTFGRIIQITAPISAGSSGSPVVNMHGQVIGIATLQITGGQSVNFAIPSERISQLQIVAPMSLSELVVASGRNKRAKAVQYFRDGLSFLSKDDCEKALVSFEKAVESDSNYAEAWAQSGFCNEKLGKHAEALEASRRAVNLRPSAESYFNIGLANFYLKQYKEAVDGYRQAIKLDPYNSSDAYYALALVYRDWGKPDEEIQSYKQAIRLRPDYILAYERLGTRYLRSKKFAEAAEIFRQIATLKPGDPAAPNNLGEAYLELNRLNEAQESFRQAIRLKPDFGKAYYNLGKCLLTMGNRDGALEQYNILQNIDQDWAEKLNGLINP
ncbi:MAG TPA: trypsin-like peptidase domain-containing protein [Pyrinomonadaceae bacterium]|jgi:Trypsin-like serine proteases, typically periplasmic, contain C-terminal PDZ domain|nr:trypsin-like peptidase domain-containing protein [Pyrinomonadaceae bacterium]